MNWHSQGLIHGVAMLHFFRYKWWERNKYKNKI